MPQKNLPHISLITEYLPWGVALGCMLLASSALAQPALPIPEPGMDPGSPSPTPSSLFLPVDPGRRPVTSTPRQPVQIPSSTSTPVPVHTPIPVATPTPLSVPSDFPAPDASQPVQPIVEDTIPAEVGPDLSTGEMHQVIPEPGPTSVATPTPRPQSRPKPQSRPPSPEKSVAPSMNQINQWVNQATSKQDAALAERIGWAFYNRGDLGSAGIWFSQALDWNPKQGDAAYGLALTKFREGDASSAEAIVNFQGAGSSKMKSLEGDIHVKRAMDYYELGRYGQSLEYMQKAAACRPLTRNEQIILAWDYYYTKNYEQSSALFQKLYQNSRDEQSAEGLYASLSKMQDYDQLELLSTGGGPLKRIYKTYDAQRYYKAGLFRASQATGGDKIYPELVNLNSPSVSLGIGYRSKSGTEGEGALQTGIFPIIQGQFAPTDKTIITAWLNRVTLNAGDLGLGAQVGNVPEEYTPYLFEPQTEFNDLWEFGIGFAYQDWWSYYFQLSTTPQNGPLTARPVGNAGIIYRDLQGYVQGEIYSKSIKESILSYIGMKDPYTGQTWGRVVETGGSLSIFRSIGNKNTIYARASYGWIDGSNTEDNTHFSGVIALAHEFTVPGYEYVTVGPAVSYETFDNNQNHFTYGNGGYFSPQYLLQGLIQAQFLTKEGRKWLAGGSAGIGLQNNKQNASPYFPLKSDGREFPSTESTTGIGLINVTGGYLINPNWMIGGSAGYSVTADYNEGYINIWVRYFFEPRNGLVRDDLGLQGLTPVY